jgi:hypothetical protein
MAMRKEKIKQQFDEFLAAGVLEPGEQIEGGVFTQTGPSPWFAGAIGILIYLAMGARWGFFAVTDRRVLFVKASIWSQRPKDLMWSDPKSEIRISDVVADAAVWSKFRYHRPDGAKPVRVNVNRIWRDELQSVMAALALQTNGS